MAPYSAPPAALGRKPAKAGGAGARAAFALALVASFAPGLAHALEMSGPPVIISTPIDQEAITGECFNAPSDTCYKFGEIIEIKVTFDADIAVASGAENLPHLAVIFGTGNAAETKPFPYDPNHSDNASNAMVFTYTVQFDDEDDDGISTSSFASNAASITNTAGDEMLTLNAGSIFLDTHRLNDQASHAVDGLSFPSGAPEIELIELISTPEHSVDTYGLGEVIAVRITFTSAVTVAAGVTPVLGGGGRTNSAANPDLRCETAGAGVVFSDFELAYDRGHASETPTGLIFTYTVAAGDCDEEGIVLGLNPAIGSPDVDDFYLGTGITDDTQRMVNPGALGAIRDAQGRASLTFFTPMEIITTTVPEEGGDIGSTTPYNVDTGLKPSNLESLTVSHGTPSVDLTLTPAFDSTARCFESGGCTHDTDVPRDTTTVSYMATAATDATISAAYQVEGATGDPTAITGDGTSGTVTLGEPGSVTILTLTVSQTAQTNDSTYEVRITRTADADSTLSNLQVFESDDTTRITFNGSFSSDVFGPYQVSIPRAETSVNVRATLNSSFATGLSGVLRKADATTDDAAVTMTSGTSTLLSGLEVGRNVFTITVTAEDDSTTDYILHVVRQQSMDSTLSELEVFESDDTTEISLDTNFAAATTGPYEVSIPRTATSVNVRATVGSSLASGVSGVLRKSGATDDDAAITMTSGTSTLLSDLAFGTNVFTITVTAEDSSTTAYTLNIVRQADTDSTLSALQVFESDGTTTVPLDMTFAADTAGPYAVSIPRTESSVNVRATLNSSFATALSGVLMKAGAPGADPAITLTSGTSALLSNLTVGTNVFTITVTAEDNSTTAYTLNIVREVDTDATLSALQVLESDDATTVSLDTTFAADSAGPYGVSIPRDQSSVNVQATLNSSFATGLSGVLRKAGATSDDPAITMTSGTSALLSGLVFGTNVFTITVTAEDDSTMAYTLNIVREVDMDATLSALQVFESDDATAIALDATFAANSAGPYGVSIPRGQSSVNVRATLNSAFATGLSGVLRKAGTAADDPAITMTSGTSALLSGLVVGTNVFTITVTAEDDSTMAYTLNIVRQTDMNSALSNLQAFESDDATTLSLDTSFATDNAGPYRVDLPRDQSSLNVRATAASSLVTSISGVLRKAGAAAADPAITMTSGTSALLTGLVVGTNVFTITVTAEDSSTTAYTLNIVQEAATDSTLSALQVFESDDATTVSLDTAFAADSAGPYGVTIPRDQSSVNVRATLNSSFATGVSGVLRKAGASSDDPAVSMTSGTSTLLSGLVFGTNVFTITVTAEDDSTMAYTLNIVREVDMDATLSALQVFESDGTTTVPLDMTFAADTAGPYEVSIPRAESSVNVRATANSVFATGLSGVLRKAGASADDPAITMTSGTSALLSGLVVGTNVFTVTVTAEDDSTTAYTLNIVRNADADSTLSALQVFESDDATAIALDTTFAADNAGPYQVTIPPEQTSVNVRATANSAFATSLSGVLRKAGEPGDDPAVAMTSGTSALLSGLVFGANVFTITVTAEDTSTTAYTLNIVREADTDSSLSELQVFESDDATAVSFAPAFAADNTGPYQATIPNAEISVNVRATATSSTISGLSGVLRKADEAQDDPAVAMTSGTSALLSGLDEGTNVFTITVTAQDGSTTDYTLRVERSMPLMLSGRELRFRLNRPVEGEPLPEASGGVGMVTYALEGDLPPGLSFDANTRVISGTPTAGGEYMLTYRATDVAMDEMTAQVQIRVSATEDLLRRHQVILPEVSRAMADQTVSAISRRAMGVLHGEASNSLSLDGRKNLAEALTAQGTSLLQGQGDLKALLASSEFAASAQGMDGLGVAGVWGQGDYRDFSGDGDGVVWDSEMFGVHGGLDARVGEDMVLGVAVSWQDGEADYRDAVAETTGEYELDAAGVYPYIGWTTGQMDVWAMAGQAEGDMTTFEHGDGDRFDNDIELRVYAFGGNAMLRETSECVLEVRGEFLLAELDVEGGEDEGAIDLTARRARLSLDATGIEQELEMGAYLAPWGRVGLRVDSGDGRTGTGVEAAAGVRVSSMDRRLTLHGEGRVLMLHNGDYDEWGVGGALVWAAEPSGMGLSVRMSPSWGFTESRASELWEHEDALGAGDAREFPGGRMNMDVGYGFMRSNVRVTPYGRMTLSEQDGRSWRLGSEMRLWRARQELALDVETFVRERESGSNDHGIQLDLRLNW